MSVYPLNCQKITARILEKFPHAKPVTDEKDHLGYVLWMIGRLPQLDSRGKIDRWMGCVHGMVQVLDLFSFDELRELTRQDIQSEDRWCFGTDPCCCGDCWHWTEKLGTGGNGHCETMNDDFHADTPTCDRFDTRHVRHDDE